MAFGWILAAVLGAALLALGGGSWLGSCAPWPWYAPGPVLLAALAGGPRLALGLLVLLRVLAAAAAGHAALLPAVPLRVDAVVTATVAGFPESAAGRVRFPVTVDAAPPALGGVRRILVTWYEPPAVAPAPGEQWRFGLRLRAPRGLANPGAFDYERWLFAAGIDATGYVRDPAASRRLGAGTGASAWLLRQRWRLAERVRAAAPEPLALPYLLGLSIGAYAALPAEEWELLRRTGTVHLVSVSGFHLTLVALPLALAGACAGLALGGRGGAPPPRVAGALCALAGATAYGALAGFTVPTLRSLCMLAAVAIWLVGRRPAPVATLLALSAAVALLIDPLGVLSPGFWLSFGGVLALAVVLRDGPRTVHGAPAGPAAQGLARLRRALGELARAQVGVGVALLPLSVAWFGQVSLAGSLANLVAIPVFSLALLPAVLAGVAVAMVDPALAVVPLTAASAVIAWWRDGLAVFADLPLALVELPPPGIGALGLALVGVGLALWPRPWPLRLLAPACWLPLVVAEPPAPPPGAYEVRIVDVGQGLAVLVRTARHALLYDTGPGDDEGDAGERAVVPVLRAAGVARLDRLIVSHGDRDHAGGARSVLARYPQAVLLATQWAGAPVAGRRPCLAGDRWTWDSVAFEVIHPPRSDGPGGDNELSCVLVVSAAGGRTLLPGDIGARSEAALVAAGLPGPVDLVVAPHHGSRGSSTPAFVARLRPRYVVFATGYANRWDFPRPEVVARWRAVGACPIDTAQTGAVQFMSSPDAGLRLASTERAAAGPVWRRPGSLARCAERPRPGAVYSDAGLVAP